jgi:pantoate--beta-alanine ligase
MGYLHEGHVSLLDGARRECASVVMSLFVNPLQFDEPDDLDRYPSDVQRDLDLAAEAGVDVVFAPDIAEMYPEPPLIGVSAGQLALTLEGASRPGHFDGVALVVTKLLAGVQPDRAYFGKKDAQQLAIVRRLVFDLSLPVWIEAMPTIRESDGVALGSRNVFLSPQARVRSRALSRGLFEAADLAESGELRGHVLEAAGRAPSAADGSVPVEYVALVARDDVAPIDRLDRPAFLAIAAQVDGVRLIDNISFDWIEGRAVADRGVRLEGPSWLYARGET